MAEQGNMTGHAEDRQARCWWNLSSWSDTPEIRALTVIAGEHDTWDFLAGAIWFVPIPGLKVSRRSFQLLLLLGFANVLSARNRARAAFASWFFL